jgi:hypothetical protein
MGFHEQNYYSDDRISMHLVCSPRQHLAVQISQFSIPLPVNNPYKAQGSPQAAPS